MFENHDNYFRGTRLDTNGFNKIVCDLRRGVRSALYVIQHPWQELVFCFSRSKVQNFCVTFSCEGISVWTGTLSGLTRQTSGYVWNKTKN